jgi:hypothetical protein
VIDDVEIEVMVDDNNRITDISIKQGVRAVIYTVKPPYSNISDGLKFIESISGVDDLLKIKRMAIDLIEKNFISETPKVNYVHHNTEEATFHTDPYDPDYMDILREKIDEEKSIKKKKQE